MNDYGLTEREENEVRFACAYVDDFGHGTSGHLAYNVISKLYRGAKEKDLALASAVALIEQLGEELGGASNEWVEMRLAKDLFDVRVILHGEDITDEWNSAVKRMWERDSLDEIMDIVRRM